MHFPMATMQRAAGTRMTWAISVSTSLMISPPTKIGLSTSYDALSAARCVCPNSHVERNCVRRGENVFIIKTD